MENLLLTVFISSSAIIWVIVNLSMNRGLFYNEADLEGIQNINTIKRVY